VSGQRPGAERPTVDPSAASAFLGSGRIAVVGASPDRASFGGTLYRALRDHGNDVVAVNRSATPIDGEEAFADLADVPGTVDGVLVVVDRDRAADVVHAAADRGVERVWLFKGIGGRGADSDEAIALCRHHGIEVIAGACPLMFLEPVAAVHRIHRAIRRAAGAVARTA
jgi:hypothetical protein